MTDKTTEQVTGTWDTFAAEAARPDYVLGMPDGAAPLHITNPTAVQVFRIGRAVRDGDDEAIVINLCGDSYARLLPLLAKTGNKAVPAFIEVLMEHFDMYEDVELVGPGGGKVTKRKPTEIQRLLRIGYKVSGE